MKTPIQKPFDDVWSDSQLDVPPLGKLCNVRLGPDTHIPIHRLPHPAGGYGYAMEHVGDVLDWSRCSDSAGLSYVYVDTVDSVRQPTPEKKSKGHS